MNLWTDNYCLETDEDRKLQISRNLFSYINNKNATTLVATCVLGCVVKLSPNLESTYHHFHIWHIFV